MFNNKQGNRDYAHNENSRAEWQSASTYNHRHVGYYLKQARESFNLTIEEVSDTIRVRRLYLEAIEEGRYDQLPGTAYAVGFVRIYANFLGLNAARVVEQFRAETGPRQNEVEFEFEQAAPPIENRSMPKNIIIVISLGIAILVLLGYLIFGRSRVETSTTDASDIPSAPQQLSADNNIGDNTLPTAPSENINNPVDADNSAAFGTSDNFDNLSLEGVENDSNGLLGNIPSNADNIGSDVTIEDLIEGTGGNTLLDSVSAAPTQQQVERYGILVNNYALPTSRGLDGWQKLNSVSIPTKPFNWSGEVPVDSASNNNDIYAANALVTDVANSGNMNIESNANPIGVEPKLRILAKEDSFIYVFKQSDASELRVGPLIAGNSYVIPEGEDTLLTYTGNVVIVVDGQYEVPVNENSGNKRSVLNYDKLKQQAQILYGQ